MAQAAGAPQTMTPTAAPQALLPRPGNTSRSIQRLNNQSLTDTIATNLPDRIVGGKVVRSESGLIVVQSSGSHDSLLPTDLTTDAWVFIINLRTALKERKRPNPRLGPSSSSSKS